MTAANTTPCERIYNQALSLPRGDRAELAYTLIKSVCEPSPEKDAIDAAWGREIRRRIAEYKAGGVETVDADECIRGVQAALAAARQPTGGSK